LYLVQPRERGSLLRNQRDAGGLAIEAVGKLEKRASGRMARSDSITPCATPLPPCTAMPEGLSMAMIHSSSKSTGNR
jgi:hypothetical protein